MNLMSGANDMIKNTGATIGRPMVSKIIFFEIAGAANHRPCIVFV